MTLSLLTPMGVAMGDDDDTGVQFSDDTADIHDDVRSADGSVEVLIRLDSAAASVASGDARVQELKRHSETTQRDVLRYAEMSEGIDVQNTFYIMNAVFAEIDTDQVDLDELARIENVDRIVPNAEMEVLDPVTTSAPDDASSDANTTYGLEQINATEVWDAHGTMGEGAKIAIIDSGVDPDHPDIDITDENFQEFENSQPVDSDPHATTDHGTHVSGSATGGNASGEYIGVAPDAELMHGLALPGGGASTANLVAGFEWAVENEADAVSMSFGPLYGGFVPDWIEPFENARDAGTMPIGSAGNSGDGSSGGATGSPGNLYSSFGVGASAEDASIADFSSGEEIDTQSAWGDDAPDYWPDEYVSPSVSAPGDQVTSSVPGGDYDVLSGTSMAAPHVAGAVGLMVAASDGDATIDEIEGALWDTAWKPADWDEPEDERDIRYGYGIIDAKAATDEVALESGVEGTVTDADGDPIEGATVELVDVEATATDVAGEYSMLAFPGDYTVTADAFGHAADSADVTIENETFTTHDFSLEDALDARVADNQESVAESGDSISTTLETANAESIAVEMTGDYDAADATLTVDGEEVDFGEPVEYDDPQSGTVTVGVATTENTSGEFTLEHTVEGLDDSTTVATGPTLIFEEFTNVAVVDDEGEFGSDVVDTLEEELSAQYAVTTVDAAEAIANVDEYAGFVVQQLDESNGAEFVDEVEGSDTGVVYLDQWGDDSNAVPVHSQVTDDPTDTSEDYDYVEKPVFYEVEAEHPIFDDAAVGDEIVLHEGEYGSHTWFNDTAADVIGSVGNQETMAGSALAVDDESDTVFASTLGRSEYATDDTFTADADAILASAVTHLVEGEEPPDEPADFQVEITGTNAPVTEGDDLEVEATVTNEGDGSDTQDVELLDFGSDVVDTEEVALDGGESADITLTWETDDGDAGTDDVTVESADDSDTAEVTVEDSSAEPPVDGELNMTDADGPEGETVTTELEATADAIAGYETTVEFDPDVVQVEEIAGVDFDDPVQNVDNDEGWFSIAQAQATGADAPTLAEITWNVTAGTGETTDLALSEDSYVNDESGEELLMELDDGQIESWSCQAGDVNADGEINPSDATLTQQYIAGDDPENFHVECADMNDDGAITSADVTLILQEIVANSPNAQGHIQADA